MSNMICICYNKRYSPCFTGMAEKLASFLISERIPYMIIGDLCENKYEKLMNETNNHTVWWVFWPNLPFWPRKAVVYNMDPLTDDVVKSIQSVPFLKEDAVHDLFVCGLL
eukprot:Pgem_evm1s19738